LNRREVFVLRVRIALIGNPNCGKTTMFNDLTGSNQYVGNWPGVTVEKKEGVLKKRKDVVLTDLPGIYSLSPYTLEEVVTRDYLINEKPDAIINIVDATNLERNLYLTTQILELGIPTVIALNMMDIVEKAGDFIDTEKLSETLGCPIIKTAALKGVGSFEAAETAASLAGKRPANPFVKFSYHTEKALAEIENLIKNRVPPEKLRWYAVKVFERDENVLKQLALPEEIKNKAERMIRAVEKELDDDAESIITDERYKFIEKLVKKCVLRKKKGLTATEKIDRILTNRVLALPIFALIIFGVYYVSVTWVGALVTEWTSKTLFADYIVGNVKIWLENLKTADWLNGFILHGIIGGVGSVLEFVPQMFILFFLLCLLEDCGYMARVAFIMDKVFRRFGLSGKSFIPLLVSSGCGVPGVLSTKTIENEKDRRMTIMTATFIPCGAKLTVIAFFGGAMFPDVWYIAPLLYFLGIFAVAVSGVILKKTKYFASDPPPFVMELPQYHLPSFKSVLMHVWERVKAFIVKAGTVIFLASGAIWFLSSFGFAEGGFGLTDAEHSLLAGIGRIFTPLFAPLGFGFWQAAVAVFSGLLAKENIVATLGVLTDSGSGAVSSLVLFNRASAASFLVFNLLCMPCVAAVGAIKREMASAKWTLFAVCYQTALAYAFSLITYQAFGLATGTIQYGFGSGAAIFAAGFIMLLLIRPNPYNKKNG